MLESPKTFALLAVALLALGAVLLTADSIVPGAVAIGLAALLGWIASRLAAGLKPRRGRRRRRRRRSGSGGVDGSWAAGPFISSGHDHGRDGGDGGGWFGGWFGGDGGGDNGGGDGGGGS